MNVFIHDPLRYVPAPCESMGVKTGVVLPIPTDWEVLPTHSVSKYYKSRFIFGNLIIIKKIIKE
jgi:hypothetical protein